ncbi:MAG: flagellar filament capping protein FliD [Pseudomonadota bacterium]
MTITSTGLATGMDINGIVAQLVRAEGQPAKNLLDRQEARLDARLSAFGKLKGTMSAFQTALKKLDALETFSARKVTASDDSAFSTTANSKAAVGSYSVEVISLAQAEKLASGNFASQDSVVGTGSLTLDVGGNSFTVAIDGTNNTLAGIRDAINKAADNTGVSASIINVDDGLGGMVSKLVLASKETGTANGLGVTFTDDDGNNTDASGLSSLAFTQQSAPKDAVIKVDGYTITRSSNTISDAVDGLSFTLKSATTSAVKVDVSSDSEEIVKAVQGFVDSYNSLRQVMSDLGNYDATTKKAAALVGDSTLRNLQQQLRRDLVDPVSSGSGGVDSLSAIGVGVDRYGVLSLDSTKLKDAMGDNLNVLVDLFQSSDGVATRTLSRVDDYLKSGGILDEQSRSMNDQKKDIADRRTSLDARLSKLEDQYYRQFNKMDLIVAQYQSTGNYLAAQLSSLLK